VKLAHIGSSAPRVEKKWIKGAVFALREEASQGVARAGGGTNHVLSLLGCDYDDEYYYFRHACFSRFRLLSQLSSRGTKQLARWQPSKNKG